MPPGKEAFFVHVFQIRVFIIKVNLETPCWIQQIYGERFVALCFFGNNFYFNFDFTIDLLFELFITASNFITPVGLFRFSNRNILTVDTHSLDLKIALDNQIVVMTKNPAVFTCLLYTSDAADEEDSVD